MKKNFEIYFIAELFAPFKNEMCALNNRLSIKVDKTNLTYFVRSLSLSKSHITTENYELLHKK
jgi:hypothetical protein